MIEENNIPEIDAVNEKRNSKIVSKTTSVQAEKKFNCGKCCTILPIVKDLAQHPSLNVPNVVEELPMQ